MADLSPDERNAIVRGWVWTYWGQPPTAQEQKTYADLIQSKGLDLALAAVTDHPNHAKFRAKRGF